MGLIHEEISVEKLDDVSKSNAEEYDNCGKKLNFGHIICQELKKECIHNFFLQKSLIKFLPNFFL